MLFSLIEMLAHLVEYDTSEVINEIISLKTKKETSL